MKKIGVLGTGTMGAGIIQVLAQNGYEVVMRARRETSIEKGLATVKKNGREGKNDRGRSGSGIRENS